MEGQELAALGRANMIEIQHVSKVYQSGNVETQALDDVTFTVQSGEFMAIMGPSGSGKSTLMHIIGALDTLTDGRYFLDGQDVSKLSDDELAEIRNKKIGFVFQAFNLLSRSTVFRNVSLPLVYSNVSAQERDDKVRKALMSAGLPEDRWYHLSNQLSGGQMQRVAIARALVNDPVIILADEPTGNLDTKTGEVVLGAFQELNRKEKRTVILITHEPYVAEHADRIIHIRDGKIVEDETNRSKREVNNHT